MTAGNTPLSASVPSVTVAIPTKNAGPGFGQLIGSLRSQTLAPEEILVIDSGSADGTISTAQAMGCRTMTIRPDDFNHGRTRNLAWRASRSDVVVFTVQDAIPANADWLKPLVRTLREDASIAAAGSRQLPARDAATQDRAARETMYPSISYVRSSADFSKTGLRTLFLSNAAAAYRRSALQSVGGFSETVIVAEDMEITFRFLRAGYRVAYVSDSCVLHSHSYGPGQQFQRNFDMGVFFATNPDVATAGSSQSLRGLGKEMLGRAFRASPPHYWPSVLADATARAAGLSLGRHYRWLPAFLRRAFSRTPSFWNRHLTSSEKRSHAP